MVDLGFIQPNSLEQALDILLERGPSWRILAGCTDILVQLRAAGHHASDICGLVDISALTELRGICVREGELTIGSLTTFADLLRDPAVQAEAPILREMAFHMGSPQIRNRATLGGNLANGSSSADSIPPLLILDAVVELSSAVGTRRLPVSQFVLGPKRTALGVGEILTHIYVPRTAARSRWYYCKLGRRNSAAISRVTVAAMRPCGCLGEHCACRLAVGAVTPVPVRLHRVEASLQQSDAAVDLERAAALAREEVEAIAGRRWSSGYKLPVVQNLVRRALASVYEVDESEQE